jgi:hypothetical protein
MYLCNEFADGGQSRCNQCTAAFDLQAAIDINNEACAHFDGMAQCNNSSHVEQLLRVKLFKTAANTPANPHVGHIQGCRVGTGGLSGMTWMLDSSFKSRAHCCLSSSHVAASYSTTASATLRREMS